MKADQHGCEPTDSSDRTAGTEHISNDNRALFDVEVTLSRIEKEVSSAYGVGNRATGHGDPREPPGAGEAFPTPVPKSEASLRRHTFVR